MRRRPHRNNQFTSHRWRCSRYMWLWRDGCGVTTLHLSPNQRECSMQHPGVSCTAVEDSVVELHTRQNEGVSVDFFHCKLHGIGSLQCLHLQPNITRRRLTTSYFLNQALFRCICLYNNYSVFKEKQTDHQMHQIDECLNILTNHLRWVPLPSAWIVEWSLNELLVYNRRLVMKVKEPTDYKVSILTLVELLHSGAPARAHGGLHPLQTHPEPHIPAHHHNKQQGGSPGGPRS